MLYPLSYEGLSCILAGQQHAAVPTVLSDRPPCHSRATTCVTQRCRAVNRGTDCDSDLNQTHRFTGTQMA